MKKSSEVFKYLSILVVFHYQVLFSQNLSDNLLIHYPFDGNAQDVSGNGFHGSPHATLASDKNGNLNSSYFFDGIDDYIDFPASATLKPSLPISFAFWIKLSSIQPSVLTNDFINDQHTGASVTFSSDGRIAVNYGDGGVTLPEFRRTKVGTTRLQVGTWYHFLGVIRGPLDMDIFLNGVNDCGDYNGTGGTMSYSSQPGSIGRKDASTSLPPYYFHGYLDDFYYWKREVSIAEIFPSGIISDVVNIKTFSVPGQTGASIIDNVQHAIICSVACSADVTRLTPSFQLSSGAVATVNGTQQISGITSNNFTSPIVYKVSAPAGCPQQNWTVRVNKVNSITIDKTNIQSFSVPGQLGASVIDVAAHSIKCVILCSADITKLVPLFQLALGASAFVNNVAQTSGVTANNFTNTVIYKIKYPAECNEQDWLVSIVLEKLQNPDDLAKIESFSFGVSTEDIRMDAINKRIDAYLPCYIDEKKLKAILELTPEAIAIVNDVLQTSGSTINDFSNVVTYKISQPNKCYEKIWTINVKKDIVSDEAELLIPNVITPNGDGKNDTFELGGSLPCSHLKIVNRYGTEVYENICYDNTFNGNHLSTGVYFFIITSNCLNKPIKGHLSILR